MNPLRKTYNSSISLEYAATDVRNTIDDNLGNEAINNRNLAIAHSMGGLVVRNIDRLTPSDQKRFGGLVTVCSPNYGAPISNSLLDGSVTSAANNAAVKLLAGPIAQVLPLDWIIGNLSFGSFLTFNPMNIANSLINNDEIQNLFGNPAINNELKVGSATVNSINYYSSTIPRISMYATETSPVHWRLIGSTLIENESLQETEQDFVNKINSARGVYHTLHDGNRALGVINLIGGILNPNLLPLSAYHFHASNEWRKGRDWFDNSESIWNTLIKTSKPQQIPIIHCQWISCGGGGNGWPEPNLPKLPDPGAGGCDKWVCYPASYWVTVNFPSDGLVPQYSQVINGLPTGNVYQIKNANHIEVRNMSNSPGGDNTRARFNEIFSYRQPGDFFLTPTR